MKLITVNHKFGASDDKTLNVGVLAVSTTGGEIAFSWQSTASSPSAGSTVFRPSSPLYRSDNPSAGGVLTVPLDHGVATVAAVVVLNNSPQQATYKLAVSVGNVDGSSPGAQELSDSLQPGDSESFQIIFVPGRA